MTDAPRVVVVGTGFAGLESAFYLSQRLGKRVDITVVSEHDSFLFKPNTIYIPFGKPASRFYYPTQDAFKRRHIRFTQTRATNVDPVAHQLITDTGTIPFTHLLIATGSTMRPDEVPGLAEHASTIWTPAEMEKLGTRLGSVIERAKSGSPQRVLFLVPPKNKCSGPLYEMVFMLDAYLRRLDVRDRVSLTYASFEHSYIQAFGNRLHQYVVEEFARRGIAGHLEWPVERIDAGTARFADDRALDFDLLISFPPYAAAVTYDTLPSDDRGFLTTDEGTRQVLGYPDIYAVGDAGDFPVKQAFLALLQADAAAEHLSQRVLHEEPSARFDPVSMCIMEQFDTATFAKVPLQTTGDPEYPVQVRQNALDQYKVGSGKIWRVGKKMLGTAMPHSFNVGKPFHAGPSWAMMEAGLGVMETVFAD